MISQRVDALLVQLIAKVDDLISAQLSEIIHHQRFQTFETRWRSLAYLVDQTRKFDNVKIKIYNVSKAELRHDLCHQIEFDQSIFFNRIYSDEFGHAGGEPFNVLISDLYFSHHMADVDLLNELGQVAAAAFCPFIAGVHPHFFGVDATVELGKIPKKTTLTDQPDYLYWHRMRQREDNRFLALTVGRFLLRKPYDESHQAAGGFCFRDPKIERGYLWANSAFALAVVIAEAFGRSGWFADILGGFVPIAKAAQLNDIEQMQLKQFQAEVGISSLQEPGYATLGLIPLCQSFPWCENVFYSCQTLHQPKNYTEALAADNASMSVKLNYLLCASRFAHYIRILGRDKMGSFATAMECEHFLTKWLFRYTVNNEVPANKRSEFPLQESHVTVKTIPGQPGRYRCIVHLKPHFQLENINATLMLVSELG